MLHPSSFIAPTFFMARATEASSPKRAFAAGSRLLPLHPDRPVAVADASAGTDMRSAIISSPRCPGLLLDPDLDLYPDPEADPTAGPWPAPAAPVATDGPAGDGLTSGRVSASSRYAARISS